jgi:hypothetical protein
VSQKEVFKHLVILNLISEVGAKKSAKPKTSYEGVSLKNENEILPNYIFDFLAGNEINIKISFYALPFRIFGISFLMIFYSAIRFYKVSLSKQP